MNLDLTGGSGTRRAALHLHAMRPADRAWLLASLAPERRARLEVLLQELRALGIPPDLEMPQAVKPIAAPAPAPRALTATERLEQLPTDGVDWLAARLHEEPPEVAALLLSGREWPWRGALVERLDAQRRQCVAAWANAPRRALAQAAVIEALGRLLPLPAPVNPAPRAVLRWWSRK